MLSAGAVPQYATPMKRSWLCIVLLVAGTLVRAQTAPLSNSVEVYKLGGPGGEAIEQMVKAIVGESGNVTYDAKNQRLLVLANAAQHKQIADLVSKTAVTPKNVRIDVAFSGGELTSERGASVSGNVGVDREDGITHVRWKIKPQVVDRSTESSSETRQQLLVSSGHEARLRVGESVPYQSWLVDYGIRCGALVQNVQWREVGSFLVVEPTVIGDGPFIRVRITPELSGMVDGSPLHTRFAAVSTDVTVSDGETIQIGGNDKTQEFYSRFLVGAVRSGGTQKLSISLTPRIAGMPPRTAVPPPGTPVRKIKVWGEEKEVPITRP